MSQGDDDNMPIDSDLVDELTAMDTNMNNYHGGGSVINPQMTLQQLVYPQDTVINSNTLSGAAIETRARLTTLLGRGSHHEDVINQYDLQDSGIRLFYGDNIPNMIRTFGELIESTRDRIRTAGHDPNDYQFRVVMTDEDETVETEDLNPTYRLDTSYGRPETVMGLLRKIFHDLYNKYNDHEDGMDFINPRYIRIVTRRISGQTRYRNSVRGTYGVDYVHLASTIVANREFLDKWYLVNPVARINCGYQAVAIAKNWNLADGDWLLGKYCKENKNFSKEKQQKAGERLKYNLKKKFGDKIEVTDRVDEKIFEYLAAYCQCQIHMYNVDGECFKKYLPSTVLLKSKTRVKVGPPLSILQVPGVDVSHAIAMIPKDQLAKKYPSYKPHYWFLKPKPEQNQILQRKAEKKDANVWNNKIIAMDCETTTRMVESDPIGKHKQTCYAIGLAYESDDQYHYKSYWDAGCIPKMLKFMADNSEMFDGHTCYMHNGGKFDLYIILNQGLIEDPNWRIDAKSFVELNSAVISLTIIHRTTKHKIRFLDSYRLLSGSLDGLAKGFKLKHQKQEAKVKVGDKELSLHDVVTMDNFRNYPQLKEYLKYDCYSLLELMLKISHSMFHDPDVGINITDCITAANLAKKLFFKKFYHPEVVPIYTLTTEQDSYIRGFERYDPETGKMTSVTGYAGGRVEIGFQGKLEAKYITWIMDDGSKRLQVVKGTGIYYMDFTSLYPDVGRYNMPVGKPTFLNKQQAESLFDGDRWNGRGVGFFRVLVHNPDPEACKGHTPLHARLRDGKLMFEWFAEPTEIVIFSEELKYSLDLGLPYDYEILDAYMFGSSPVLKEFFETGFKKKAELKESNPAGSYMWKIKINSGYGFWGLKTIRRDGVKIYYANNNELVRIWMEERLKEYKCVGDYMFIRSENDLPTVDKNVGIAAAVTSYARMKLYDAILHFRKHGNVDYCDTDSLVTNVDVLEYPEVQAKFCPDGTGKALGSLKNEAVDKLDSRVGKYEQALFRDMEGRPTSISWDRAYILGAKMYCLEYDYKSDEALDLIESGDLQPTVRAIAMKGYRKSDRPLTGEDFEYMLSSGDHFIQQEQMQLRAGKASLLNNKGEMRRVDVTKKFKKIYNKGVVTRNGRVEPFYFEAE